MAFFTHSPTRPRSAIIEGMGFSRHCASIGFLISVLAVSAPGAARADSLTPPAGPSLSELNEIRQSVEARHEQKMKDIDSGLAIQAYDADTALMMRVKADQEYKSRLEALRAQEEATYRQLDAKQSHSTDSSLRMPANSTPPSFESHGTVTYPQGDPEAPPAEDKPQNEGHVKTTGFGTRELEF